MSVLKVSDAPFGVISEIYKFQWNEQRKDWALWRTPTSLLKHFDPHRFPRTDKCLPWASQSRQLTEDLSRSFNASKYPSIEKGVAGQRGLNLPARYSAEASGDIHSARLHYFSQKNASLNTSLAFTKSHLREDIVFAVGLFSEEIRVSSQSVSALADEPHGIVQTKIPFLCGYNPLCT